MLRLFLPFRPALLLAALLVSPLALVAQTPAEILARYTRTIDPEGKSASIQGMKLTLRMEIPRRSSRRSPGASGRAPGSRC